MSKITLTPAPLSYQEIKAILSEELIKLENIYVFTIRGLARLLDISASLLTDNRIQKNGVPRGIFQRLKSCSQKELPKSLRPFAGFDYQNSVLSEQGYIKTYAVPDYIAIAIIKYYAYESRKPRQRALQLDAMIVRALNESLLEQDANDSQLTKSMPKHKTEEETFDTELEVESNTKSHLITQTLSLFQKLEAYSFSSKDIKEIVMSAFEIKDISCVTYYGVKKHGEYCWEAYIVIKDDPRHIGFFNTSKEAAKAYDGYAKVLHGSKARLNFPN